MTLPSSGTISASMINIELGRAENAAFSLNDPAVRALAGKPTGAISFNDFHGKSSYERQPATGVYYHSATRWIAYISPFPGHGRGYWESAYAFYAPTAAIVSIVSGGWRYHREDNIRGWGNGGNEIYCGIWRETAGTDKATYIEVREPAEAGSEYYNTDNYWRLKIDNTASSVLGNWIKWGGIETSIGGGSISSFENEGWTYHRGDYVGEEVIDGQVYMKYKVYRRKIEIYVPPPFREPQTGADYSGYRKWQHTAADYNFAQWDDLTIPLGTGLLDSAVVGDWEYHKGGLMFSSGGHSFYAIYRVKTAAADTKAREPATGAAYIKNGTDWVFDTSMNRTRVAWYITGETVGEDGEPNFIELDGWRYHRGELVEDDEQYKRYKVWREEM